MSFIREVRKDIELEAIRLMREYRANLIVEAKRLCRDDSVAEDLAMKTIEVYMSKPEEELPPAEKSLAYLKSILTNIYRDSVRGKAQACMVYLDPEDMERIDELEQADNSTDEAILAHSDAELVRNAIARLPESARSAIVMHYFESLTISQIAELLKKSPDSVKSNLYYARKVLAKRLAKALGRTSAAVIALLLAALGYAAVTFTGVFTPSEPPDAVAAEQTAAENAADSPPAAEETPGETVIEATVASDREQDMKTNELTVAKTLAVSAILSLSSVRAETDAYGNEIAYSSDGETVEYKFWHSNSTSEEMSGEDSSTAVSTEPVSVDSRSFSRGACTGRIVTTPAPPEGFLVIVK